MPTYLGFKRETDLPVTPEEDIMYLLEDGISTSSTIVITTSAGGKPHTVGQLDKFYPENLDTSGGTFITDPAILTSTAGYSDGQEFITTSNGVVASATNNPFSPNASNIVGNSSGVNALQGVVLDFIKTYRPAGNARLTGDIFGTMGYVKDNSSGLNSSTEHTGLKKLAITKKYGAPKWLTVAFWAMSNTNDPITFRADYVDGALVDSGIVTLAPYASTTVNRCVTDVFTNPLGSIKINNFPGYPRGTVYWDDANNFIYFPVMDEEDPSRPATQVLDEVTNATLRTFLDGANDKQSFVTRFTNTTDFPDSDATSGVLVSIISANQGVNAVNYSVYTPDGSGGWTLQMTTTKDKLFINNIDTSQPAGLQHFVAHIQTDGGTGGIEFAVEDNIALAGAIFLLTYTAKGKIYIAPEDHLGPM